MIPMRGTVWIHYPCYTLILWVPQYVNIQVQGIPTSDQ